MAAFSRWIDHEPPYNIVALKGLLSGELGVNVARVRIRVFELDTGHLTLRLQPLLRILGSFSVSLPLPPFKAIPCSSLFSSVCPALSYASTDPPVAVGFSVGVFSPPPPCTEGERSSVWNDDRSSSCYSPTPLPPLIFCHVLSSLDTVYRG